MLHPADLGALPEIAAQRHADVPLLSDTPWLGLDRDVRTVGDFAWAVHEYADRLWATGVRRGATVAVVKANHYDIQALACAAIRVGAVPALLSVRMAPDELVTCLGLLDRPVLLVDADGIERLAAYAESLPRLTSGVFALHAPGAGWAPTLDASGHHEPIPWSGDGPMIITHSSGTTGAPKLVAQSADSLYGHAAPQIAVARQLDTTGIAAKCLSFVHARTASGLVAMLTVTMPFLALSNTAPEDVAEQLVAHRPQGLETHPNLFLLWESLGTRPQRPFASVERFLTSFDAVHPRTVRALLNGSDQPNPVYLQAYGQTETGPVTLRAVHRADLDTLDETSRNVGRPFPGITDVRIVDDAGESVPAGTPGYIEARTPGRGHSIIGQPPLPGPGEWWPMGDIGRITENGSLELLDRVADRLAGTASLLRLEDRLLDALPQLLEVVLTPGPDGALVVTVCTADDQPLELELWAKAAVTAGLPADTGFTQRRWADLPWTGSWKVRRHRIGTR
ncbi:MAG TPA: AMP-binding protein [Micromonosporaceae bacterium]